MSACFPPRKSAARFLLIALLTALGSGLDAAERPKLVIVVSVDQLCYDYLVRFRKGFAADGLFLRVEKEGASFVNCHHRHAFTITAPGHTVQMSGAYPETSGIVGNDWFDRASGKKMYCTVDPQESLVGPPPRPPKPATTTTSSTEEVEPAGVSPRNLLVDTVGDRLKLESAGKAKVFGVAFKDRVAILMTGHRADAAFWIDTTSSQWATSTYYAKELPGYMRAINEGNFYKSHAEREWKLLLDPASYIHYHADDYLDERSLEGLGKTFPHKFAAASDPRLPKQVLNSPFGNELVLHVASQIVVHEELGQDDVTDLLAINLSTNDYVGHAYGPHSLEVQDLTLRTDRQLGEFVRFVEKQLEGTPWVLALSADHGVAPLVKYAQERGLPAKRSPLGELKVLQPRLEDFLRVALKMKKWNAAEKTDKTLVHFMSESQVYLRQDHPALAGETYFVAQKLAREFLLRQSAIFAAFTREDLLSGGGNGKLYEQFRRTFHPRRSGDVLYALAPYAVGGTNGTSHGSPWNYDTHVPLLLLGSGIKPGRYENPASPAAIAPTISRLLDLEPPAACVEEPLLEALTPS
jgi:predicted AlkP superfamily pyrophosphatase or phosphodiesterase